MSNHVPFSVRVGGRQLTLFARPDDPYAQTLEFQVGELRLYRDVLRTLRSGSVVYDIGANIGLTSRLALDAGCKVYAFEPSPLARECLVRNAPQANIQAIGLGDENMITRIAQGAMLAGSHISATGDSEVSIERLDAWRARTGAPPPDLVKIDCEGYERKVLAGGRETLAGTLVLMEINPLALDVVGRISTMDMLEEVIARWGGFYHRQGNKPGFVNEIGAAKVYMHSLFTSGKIWDDIVFGRGVEVLQKDVAARVMTTRQARQPASMPETKHSAKTTEIETRVTTQETTQHSPQLSVPVLKASSDINMIVHELRGMALSQVAKHSGVMLTAGAVGTWYFEWIERYYGRVDVHIAIAEKAPPPLALPKNVRWVPEAVDRMASIGDASVAFVFSGQNIEQLPPDKVSDFLLEAHRVLRPGGTLVVDSPNRKITARSRDANPERVIEFTVDEARDLIVAAGFDIVAVKGLWLCDNPATGEPLPVNIEGSVPFETRAREGFDRPDQSYIWWIEASRSDRPADPALLRQLIAEAHARAWPERLNRLHTIVGSRITGPDGDDWFNAASEAGGVVMFGPYAPLAPGRYSVDVRLAAAPSNEPATARTHRRVRVEVYSDRATPDVIASRNLVIRSDDTLPLVVSIGFTLRELVFGVQFRVIAQPGGPDLNVRAAIKLTERLD